MSKKLQKLYKLAKQITKNRFFLSNAPEQIIKKHTFLSNTQLICKENGEIFTHLANM